MLTVIAIAFLAAILIPFIYQRSAVAANGLVILLPAIITAYLFSFYSTVIAGTAAVFRFEWIPSMQISLDFYLDGLSLFFSLMISFFGLLVLLYSTSYMQKYREIGLFFSYMIFFMGSMLGLVLASNLVTLFVFWELTSISSFLLIGFHHQSAKARYAARQSLLVTAIGGLFLLAGFILMSIAGNSFNIPELLSNPDALNEHPYLNAIILLVLIGVFTKSAQFPFHFWLPNAMKAPAPVSAYLHSAAMVKAGVYLVFRLNPVFGPVFFWQVLLVVIGSVTMILGAVKAFRADDLKQVLAFTTISSLGMFFMITGIGTAGAINAAIVNVMAHALYKGGLFLIAGIIDRQFKTRSISELSGLVKHLPYTTAAAILACMAMAGITPFISYIGKKQLYEVLYSEPEPFAIILLVLSVITGILLVAISLEIAYSIFLKNRKRIKFKNLEPSYKMVVPSLLLIAISVLLGIAPGLLLEPLFRIAAGNIQGNALPMDLTLHAGWDFVTLMSILTLAGGIGFYFLRKIIRRGFIPLPKFLTAEWNYQKSIRYLQQFAVFQTRIIQNGYIRNYISIIILFFSLFIVLLFFHEGLHELLILTFYPETTELYEMVILTLVLITLLVLFNSESRLTSVATIGIIGYGVALSYTLYSAPDVAITQILAETLSLILLILILHKIPEEIIKIYEFKAKYYIIPGLFGLLMTIVSMVMLSYPNPTELKNYFLENSLPLGHGRNVVNVILVDFRALDTLGEIIVLAITMIGIIALIKFRPKKLKK